MSLTLLFIRHGQSEANRTMATMEQNDDAQSKKEEVSSLWSTVSKNTRMAWNATRKSVANQDADLTLTGMYQARELGNTIYDVILRSSNKDVKPKWSDMLWYCSPLGRAIQTGSIAMDACWHRYQQERSEQKEGENNILPPPLLPLLTISPFVNEKMNLADASMWLAGVSTDNLPLGRLTSQVQRRLQYQYFQPNHIPVLQWHQQLLLQKSDTTTDVQSGNDQEEVKYDFDVLKHQNISQFLKEVLVNDLIRLYNVNTQALSERNPFVGLDQSKQNEINRSHKCVIVFCHGRLIRDTFSSHFTGDTKVGNACGIKIIIQPSSSSPKDQNGNPTSILLFLQELYSLPYTNLEEWLKTFYQQTASVKYERFTYFSNRQKRLIPYPKITWKCLSSPHGDGCFRLKQDSLDPSYSSASGGGPEEEAPRGDVPIIQEEAQGESKGESKGEAHGPSSSPRTTGGGLVSTDPLLDANDVGDDNDDNDSVYSDMSFFPDSTDLRRMIFTDIVNAMGNKKEEDNIQIVDDCARVYFMEYEKRLIINHDNQRIPLYRRLWNILRFRLTYEIVPILFPILPVMIYSIHTILIFQTVTTATIYKPPSDLSEKEKRFLIVFSPFLPFLSIVYYTLPLMIYYIIKMRRKHRKFISFSLILYQVIGYGTAVGLFVIMGLVCLFFYWKIVPPSSKTDAYTTWILVFLFSLFACLASLFYVFGTDDQWLNFLSRNSAVRDRRKIMFFCIFSFFVFCIFGLLLFLCLNRLRTMLYRWIGQMIQPVLPTPFFKYFYYLMGAMLTFTVTLTIWFYSTTWQFIRKQNFEILPSLFLSKEEENPNQEHQDVTTEV